MKRFSIVMLLILLAFFAGYIMMYFRVREIQSSLNQEQARVLQLQDQLQGAQVEIRLGALYRDLGVVLVQVDQKNFGTAKDQATAFFDNLSAVISDITQGERKDRLSAILGRRDATITDLSTLSPESSTHLRELFLQLREAIAG